MMKISLLRWVLTALILVIAMTICTLIITAFKYLILYFKTGSFNDSLVQILYLSMKIGLFTGVLITIGIWIMYRFDIR